MWREPKRDDTAESIIDSVRQKMTRQAEREGAYFDGTESIYGNRSKDLVFFKQLTETLTRIRQSDEWQSFDRMVQFIEELALGEDLWFKEKSYITRVNDWEQRYPKPVVRAVKRSDAAEYARIVANGTGLTRQIKNWKLAARGERPAVATVCDLYNSPNLLGKPGAKVNFDAWGESLWVDRCFPPMPAELKKYPPEPDTAAKYTDLVLAHRAKMRPPPPAAPPPAPAAAPAAPTPAPTPAAPPPPATTPAAPPATTPAAPPAAPRAEIKGETANFTLDDPNPDFDDDDNYEDALPPPATKPPETEKESPGFFRGFTDALGITEEANLAPSAPTIDALKNAEDENPAPSAPTIDAIKNAEDKNPAPSAPTIDAIKNAEDKNPAPSAPTIPTSEWKSYPKIETNGPSDLQRGYERHNQIINSALKKKKIAEQVPPPERAEQVPPPERAEQVPPPSTTNALDIAVGSPEIEDKSANDFGSFRPVTTLSKFTISGSMWDVSNFDDGIGLRV